MNATAKTVTDDRPPTSARSKLCRALRPDSAETGYPYGFQVYDEAGRRWRWLIVGCGNFRRTEDSAKRQAECHIFWRQATHGWFRWVWIERWIHRGHERGWAAVIDYSQCTAPVWVDKGRNPCKPIPHRRLS
jgi:hypothetical protein